MGGKTKQSQRTKNNVRPSSSGRSALLLSNVKEAGIINVNGTEVPALFPSLVVPNIDPLVSPELQLCIKKLNKKDPITKTKALQELSELVVTIKLDDVVAALPSWAHFYRILTTDPDRKVREATQNCHGVIVSVCGRRIAPHLKQLMPIWLQALYDEHAPAQTNAQNTLAKTFPDAKLPEVMSFCKSEVLAHLMDNLIGTGESATIQKIENPEDKALQSSRLVSSSLHGVEYVCSQLPRGHDAWLWGHLEALLQAPACWKYARHADAKIRISWYSAMGRIIERFKTEFPEKYGQKTLRALVEVKETSPVVAAQLWECVLCFMYNVEDWYKYLDKTELFKKRILDILESGGWGEARRLLAALLPLLSRLPPAVPSALFYADFFNALFTGLETKAILSSKSERQSWITSIDECLRYLSTQQEDYVVEVVTAAHRTWLEKILSDTHDGLIRTNLVRYSVVRMAALVKYWLKQAKDSPSDKYDQIIRNFWQNVGSTITTQIDKLSTNHADIGRSIDGHTLLLQTFKTSFTEEVKKQQGIKFDDDLPSDTDKPPEEMPQCDASIVDRYNHNLNDLVEKVCGHYFEFARNREISGPVLTPLKNLLVDFDSKNLFTAIAKQFGCDSPYTLYETVLRVWLAGDTMRCKVLVDIVFLLMKHLSEAEQEAVFDSFKQFPPAVVEWCVGGAAGGGAAARAWLRGPLAARALAAVADRYVARAADRDAQLLLLCLTSADDGDAAGGARLAAALLPRLPARLLRSLAHTLLRLAADAQGGAGAAVRGLRGEVVQLAHDQLLKPSNLSRTVDPPSSPPTDEQNTCNRLDVKQIEHVISLCPHLLSIDSQQDIADIVDFTKHMFDIATVDPALIETFVLRHDIVKGDINCPFEEGEISKIIIDDASNDNAEEITEQNLVTYTNDCIFRGIYLRTILTHKGNEDSQDTWCNALLKDDYIASEFCKVMHDFTLLSSMSDAYAFSPLYNIIKESKKVLDNVVKNVIYECTIRTRLSLMTRLTEISAVKGFYWSFARIQFDHLAKFKESDLTEMDEDSQIEADRRKEIAESFKCNIESDEDEYENDEEITERFQYKPEPSEKIAENKGIKPESDRHKNEPKQTIKNSEETTEIVEDEQGNIESSEHRCKNYQENIDNNHEQTNNNQHKTESGPGNTENTQEKDESCQNNNERNDAQTSNNQVKAGSNESETQQQSIWNAKMDIENFEYIVTGSGFFHSIQASERWRARGGCPLRAKYLMMVRSYYSAHSRDLDHSFLDDFSAGERQCSPDVIINAYYAHNHTMLFDQDMRAASWAGASSSAAVAEYLAELVAARGAELAAHQWDFVTIALCNLLSSVLKTKHHWTCTKVCLVWSSTLRLFLAVEQFVRELPARCQRGPPAALHLLHEWRDIFGPDLNRNLLALVAHLLEKSSSTVVRAHQVAVMELVLQCVRRAQWELVPGAQREAELARLVRGGVAVLAGTRHHAYKYLAYELLRALVDHMVLADAALLQSWTQTEAEGPPPALSLAHFWGPHRRLQDLVLAATAHIRLCEETCSLEEGSDVHGLALGWFLMADVMYAMYRRARGNLRMHYIQLYRQERACEPLLCAALRLLPADVFAAARRPAPAPAPAPARLAARFSAAPAPSLYRRAGAGAVGALACAALAGCVRGAGAAAARGWRGAAPHRRARLLDTIVTRYITPAVVKEEFTLLQQKGSELEDTEIKLVWSAYEVVCILTVDDRPMEICISLSRSHPLELPTISLSGGSPIVNANWLVMYMGYQNGSVLSALRLWAASVSRRVERAEPCYICYGRLHFGTGRLPAVQCHQCRNKFHTDCLRKWFVSSNKSTCPLCRTPF